MSHNPELQPKHVPPAGDALRPDAPDFVETPDIAPLSGLRESFPPWLYLICGFFLFFAGSSFTGFNTFGLGLLDQGAGGPVPTYAQSVQVAEPTDPMSLGAKVYKINCASCHQPDGMGQPGKVPPLAKSEWVMGNKGRLAAIVLHGLSGGVTVEGATYSTQVMAPWAGILNDEQIADVLTYIRGSNTLDNDANAITPAEIAAARAKLAAQADPYSESDLMKMAPNGPDPSDKK